ncbi:ACP S-malonyltransferase, partial [uncultured Jatrophihabitans sp.]|uniref:ACP S-malonyltransferase n=1 Tax=uncultured Jatrophihabitans sp. TaxID=1610747 RepID=UPI0035CC88A4
MIAVFAPGQGAQAPGMLAPWLELPGVEDRVARLAEAAGLDLLRLGTTADADEIKDTAVAQPLLVTAGVLAADALDLHTGEERVVAGHSVGEITAAAVSGALDAEQAVAFAARRGREMAAACAVEPTGMVAVLGGDADVVTAAIEAAGLAAANRNAAGQIVAAGAPAALEAFA